MKFGIKKVTRIFGLSAEDRMILRLLVLTQYQRVTDGWTDMPPMTMSHCSTGEQEKFNDVLVD